MVKQGSYYFSLLSKASTQGVHCPGHVRYVALRHGRVVIPAQLSGPQPAEDAEGAGRENCRNRTRNQASPRWRSFPSTSLLCGPAATCSWFSRSICPLISPALPPQPFLLREQPESLGSGIQILIAFKKKKIQRAKKHVQRALRAVMPFTTPALLATQTQSLQRELIKTATGIHKTGVTTQQAAC